MDTALLVKQKVDSGQSPGVREAVELLKQSKLVEELLVDVEPETLNLLNRLNELIEIPFTHELEKVRQWVDLLAD